MKIDRFNQRTTMLEYVFMACAFALLSIAYSSVGSEANYELAAPKVSYPGAESEHTGSLQGTTALPFPHGLSTQAWTNSPRLAISIGLRADR